MNFLCQCIEHEHYCQACKTEAHGIFNVYVTLKTGGKILDIMLNGFILEARPECSISQRHLNCFQKSTKFTELSVRQSHVS